MPTAAMGTQDAFAVTVVDASWTNPITGHRRGIKSQREIVGPQSESTIPIRPIIFNHNKVDLAGYLDLENNPSENISYHPFEIVLNYNSHRTVIRGSMANCMNRVYDFWLQFFGSAYRCLQCFLWLPSFSYILRGRLEKWSGLRF